MRLACEDRADKVVFRVSDFDRKYVRLLEMCFYQKDGDTYVKAYPRAYPHMDSVRRNFLERGRLMFDQLGYFAEVPWERALADVAERARQAGLSWWLTGS
jgi:hypothetical protein